MLRQASSRNHRTKGFKVKQALQMCLLIAICIWLLYQVKHSHEKKRAFEERNSKNLNKAVENPENFFKLGRKDLPLIHETISENETNNKEDEKEDENEEAQEEVEHATKLQEEIDDDEERGYGDDDIDEQDQEKRNEEADNGDESTEEEGKDNHDEVDLFDNQEHEGGLQEAREENYKRDDASSAVVHDTPVTESETSNVDARSMEEQVVDKDDESNDNGSKQDDDSSTVDSKSDEDSNGDGSNHDVDSSADGSKSDDDTNAFSFKGEVVRENLEEKIVESENVNNGTDDGSGGDTVHETLSIDNLSSNVTASDNKSIEADNKDLEIEFSKPDNGSVANSTIVEDNRQMEQKDNSTMVIANDIVVSNDTVNSDLAQDENITSDSATLGDDERNSQNVESEEHSTTSSLTNENEEAIHEESENLSHAVITEEEKVAWTDLLTLPEIHSELKSTDDEAAE